MSLMNEYNAPTILGRSWDSFDAYLFDIDGTLLHCSDAVHYFAFCDALQHISGLALNLDGVNAHGNTDVGILRDALKRAAIPDDRWRPHLVALQARMSSFVQAREAEMSVSVMPAVPRMLTHLRNKGATLGIATGNLRDIGRLKLKNAGLLEYFTVAGWSDAYEYRADVFRHAVEQMRHKLSSSNASICILGDTPADVLAAKANSLPVIAVATGIYSEQQLREQRPELCLQSFEQLFPSSECYL